jgi:Arc/MetJ-type ribon-helix-helix transcriptional regulator
MPTVTIRIDDELDGKLKRHLARSGQSMSEFIRGAMAQSLNTPARTETRLQSLERALARIKQTGETDLSTTYKARIKERLDAKHRR